MTPGMWIEAVIGGALGGGGGIVGVGEVMGGNGVVLRWVGTWMGVGL